MREGFIPVAVVYKLFHAISILRLLLEPLIEELIGLELGNFVLLLLAGIFLQTLEVIEHVLVMRDIVLDLAFEDHEALNVLALITGVEHFDEDKGCSC
jgi:hypothetical protein